jgi:cytochrome c-type biogenesis protein
MFVVGFLTIFVLLGVAASGLGRALALYKPLMQKVGGLMLIGMGLFMLRVIKPSWMFRELKIRLPSHQIVRWRKLSSWLVGTTFGLAWTPCVGPVLAVILFWASQTQTFWQGTWLLLAYGLGLGAPFLAVGALFEALTPRLIALNRLGNWMQKGSAVIILITGILLLTSKLEWLSIRLLKLFNLNTLAV